MAASRRALIVDDDPLVRRLFERVLAPMGFAVTEAADGNEGLARLDESAFALVVTDLRMPGADGTEVARRAASLSPTPAVVAVSGFATAADREAIAALGIPLLEKPFELEDAEAMFLAALDSSREG